MNRADLQRLATTRLSEAKILFEAELYSGAYYLSGYAIECAFKACFARRVQRYDFPDRGSTGKVFTHKLSELVKPPTWRRNYLKRDSQTSCFVQVGMLSLNGMRRVDTPLGARTMRTPSCMQ